MDQYFGQLLFYFVYLLKNIKNGQDNDYCFYFKSTFSEYFIKNIVGRVRPYNYVNNIKLLVPALSDGSFPSGHASYAFTFATIVAFMARGKMLKIFIAILAILIAFSRLYLFVHFPSDVIVGAVVGILIGTFSMRAYFKGYINQIFDKFNLQRE